MKILKIKKSMLVLILSMTSFVVQAQTISEVEKAIDAEQYQKAKELTKSLILSKSDGARNYFYLGNIYLETEQPDSALIAFDKGISVDPEYALNYVGRGAVKLEGSTDQATADFNKALEQTRKKDHQTELYIGRALIKATKPDYENAILHLQRAKEINDKDPKIYLFLGDAYHGMLKNSEAYKNYTQAFALDNSLLRAKLALGVIVKQSRAFRESADEFKKVNALDPNYAPAYRELAETYYLWAMSEPKAYKDKMKLALEQYRKYIKLTDLSPLSRMRYADFLILAGDYKTLEQEARELAKYEKSNKRIYRYLGYAAFENGNYPESEEALTEFISGVDTSRVIAKDWLYLGKALIESGKTDTAAWSLLKASEKDSTLLKDISTIAKDLYTARKYESAARIYEVAVSDSASKTYAYDNFYLGMSNYFHYAAKVKAAKDSSLTVTATADTSILARADTAFSRVIKLSPSTADAYLYRARVRRLLDDATQPEGLMVPDYEKYIELVTGKPDFQSNDRAKKTAVEAYSNLGAIAARSDNPEEQAVAVEYFNKILQLEPDNKYATSSLEVLEDLD
ncbi:tetratricopeptide repeat protein [Daejeonella lutea]|uniref:Tetratricopeptide repeat-containing protein n=1 Tax=Daejeonella lutea TaxID=572036 RepID=A0A1T5AP85_9SPHI|nr:tetratricopeptide repeat protein [Daejeonella lutea]SKB36423.1 Tetratricopeptide repeat-containing protein [Daejeonella lutea]